MHLNHHLISAKELTSLIDAKIPTLRIFDCRHSLADPKAGLAQYVSGHIPGAVHVHLDHDLSDPVGFDAQGQHRGRHPLPSASDMLKRFGNWGIGVKTDVVVYDDMNGAIAARLWWMLRAVGHTRVRVLDGGYTAWLRHASGSEQGDVPQCISTNLEPLIVSDAVYPGTFDESLVVGFSDLQRELADGRVRLLDARVAGRFHGENEPLDPPGGHIPGATNMPFADQLNADGTFKSPAELIAIYNPASPEPIVCSCGSGVTACHLILGLALAGRIDNVRLFPPSFSGWSRTPDLPIAR